jgi:predicted nucleic acid-binding protein
MRRRARRLGVEVDAGALMGVSPDRLAQSIAAHFEQLGLTLESFPSRAGFDRMCQIAERFGLSSYDALYVAFAEQRGARLLTLDRAMAAAAAGIGVATITATGPDAN